MPKETAMLLLVLMLGSGGRLQAQTNVIELNKALSLAMAKNGQIQSARLGEQASDRLQGSAVDLAKTVFSADYGKINSVGNDTRVGVSQAFNFPTVYANQRKQYEANYLAAQAQRQLTEADIRALVRQYYFEYAALIQRRQLLLYADSLFRLFEAKSQARFDKGAANVLEKTAAESNRQQISNQLTMLTSDINVVLNEFNLLLQGGQAYVPRADILQIDELGVVIADSADSELPRVELARQQQRSARFRYQTEKARLFPEFVVGYNNQSFVGTQLRERAGANLQR